MRRACPRPRRQCSALSPAGRINPAPEARAISAVWEWGQARWSLKALARRPCPRIRCPGRHPSRCCTPPARQRGCRARQRRAFFGAMSFYIPCRIVPHIPSIPGARSKTERLGPMDRRWHSPLRRAIAMPGQSTIPLWFSYFRRLNKASASSGDQRCGRQDGLAELPGHDMLILPHGG